MSSPSVWRNPVRARLEAGQPVFGLTVTSSSVEVAAQGATLGFDFLWVEMEHSPVTLETLRLMVLATRGLPAMIFARVPVVELWPAKRVLDQGVSGVMFPFCGTPEKAAIAAAACRYPPKGRRGAGPGTAMRTWPERGNYYDSADANVMTICIIEEISALDHIEAIAATEGVDVLFIGTNDLSFSMGLRGRQDDPAVQDAIRRVVDAARRHGKFVGRPAMDPSRVGQFIEQGFQFFQLPSEVAFMEMGVRQVFESLGSKGVIQGPRAQY
jgi:2-keto-3-deoxy-L-rhamnonate aldolase RhmA